MAVNKRNNRWQVSFRYRDPVTGESKRFRRSSGEGVSKRDALKLEAKWRLEAEQPPRPKIKRAAFSGFAKHWADTYVIQLKPSTQRSYLQVLRNHAVPHFGHADLRTIDAGDVAHWVAQMTCSPKTASNRHGVLRKLFACAAAWGFCEKNPAEGTELRRPDVHDYEWWTAEESAHALEVLRRHEPRWVPLIATALGSGLRAGELFALTWDDILPKAIRVSKTWTEGKLGTPKGGRPRVVPIPSSLAEMLETHPRRLGTDLVFWRQDPSPQGRLELSTNCVHKVLTRLSKRAKLARLSMHGLRHSYASQLAVRGVPLQAIQAYLGHVDIKTTQRYAHLLPSSVADFVDVLDHSPLRQSPSDVCPPVGHWRRRRGSEDV